MGRSRKTTSHANASLGRALVKTKKNTHGDKSAHEERHNTYEEKTTALKSVTEESSYDEFIATAALAEKEFTAEKLNVKFVGLSVADSTKESDMDGGEFLTEAERKAVVVPRRPKWTTEMSAEELDTLEKEAFLSWRRGMANLQNKQDITPFERNLEVWRQLWRVLERSDIVVQIVDARNPLLYRSEDLEAYVTELGKRNVILLNKADFLTEKQREYWADYFEGVNLPYAFYSAAKANEKLTAKTVTEEDESEHSDSDDEEDDDTEDENENDQARAGGDHNDQENIHPAANSRTTVFEREGLITFLKSFKQTQELFSVGLVGYPNVGKSSTINSLMGIKRTSVSATPGKTKHFQTLFLESDLLLCDCPGLVMPAFGGSKGEMVLGGILPIDQLTSYSSATALLIQRIPKQKLEKSYGISLLPNFDYEDFLSSYAAVRGFMTVRGIPDSSRAARIVLKDYVNGKLHFCLAPPSVPQEEFQASLLDGQNLNPYIEDNEGELIEPVQQRPPTLRTVNVENRLDNNFFAPATAGVHYKGKHCVSSGLTAAGSSEGGSVDKPWRKHNNKNKREKLRRVYRHLDVE
ncbi:Large subunit GTPase 1 [Orchesella cincta]|uniref:Large subunit GTPase 1 homolog n=1 Tax=Orchesella cincta TaxID=48709 RepID=A0A1D2N6I3_ORCCI|nr:Large subunit GTPase 1 [Orchesella cincta]